jgi:proteic killer suppression protein
VFFTSGEIKKGAGWTEIAKVVRRKLDMLHYAVCLNDLRSPPGNRLKELEGTMAGSYSIQWRIVFKWSNSGTTDVKIEDYH